MTSGQRISMLLVDRDRRKAHATCLARLQKARRTGDVVGAIRRPAMLAYLHGMRRMADDFHRATGRNAVTAHHELSQADDRQDEREIRDLIGKLGLSSDAVGRMRDAADRAAARVAGEVRRLTGNVASQNLSIAAVGGNVAGFLSPRGDVFGTFGRANVPDRILDTWAETVAYSQYERGRDDAVKAYPKVAEALWGFRWSSILDPVTTTGCRRLDGWVAPVGDGWMDSLRPPRHFNALAPGTLIKTARGDVPIEDVKVGDDVLTHRGRLRRVYGTMNKRQDSNLRRLNLASGRTLFVTDEHPVLTSAGWKVAGDLQVGDQVFEHVENVTRVGDVLPPNPDDHPALIDEPLVPWDVAELSPSVPVILPVEFKAHAMIGEGEVDRVAAERMLEQEGHPAPIQDRFHSSLGRRRVGPPTFAVADDGRLHDARLSHVGVAFSPLAPSLALASIVPVIHAGSLGETLLEGFGDGPLLGTAADLDPEVFAPLRGRARRESKGQIDVGKGFVSEPVPHANGLSNGGPVELRTSKWSHTPIVSIIDGNHCGKVYNLAVEDDETYVADSIVVHNCRAVLVPVWQSSELRPPTPVPPKATAADLQRYLAEKETFLRRVA